MLGFEEVRSMEGMRAPLQLRQELRCFFERWLSKPQHHHYAPSSHEAVHERRLFDLFQHYRLEYPGGARDIAQTWDQSKQRIAEGAPTFAGLVAANWIFFEGGRWNMPSAPLGTFSDIAYPSPSTKAFLLDLNKPKLIAKSDSPPADVKALVEEIDAKNWLERCIPCADPSWIAGRLWEQLCPTPEHVKADESECAPFESDNSASEADGPPDSLEADVDAIDEAFLEWSGWCAVLGTTANWNTRWGKTEQRYCREAARRTLTRQTVWGKWENDVSRYAHVLTSTFAIPEGHLRYARSPTSSAPPALVFRADWLGWSEIEHLTLGRRGMTTVGFSLGLLCSELETTDIGPDLVSVTQTVVSFVADHPMGLLQVLHRLEIAPSLLVDLLMHERTACLAAKLVIEWRPQFVRDRDRNLARDAQTKAYAVQDALSLLAYHLEKRTLDAQECAALLSWCYDSNSSKAETVAKSREPFGRQLLKMAAGASEELQSSILGHLVAQVLYRNNIHRARFAAVLSGLGCLFGASAENTLPIVESYAKFARDMNLDWTDAPSLSKELAARLVATALAQSASVRDAFLIPFDSVKLLKDASETDNPSLHSSIAQALRIHVRLLSRAVAGWPGQEVPEELSAALLALIKRNVVEHAEKWRVGALTDRYRPHHILGREEGSPARDIAAAWRRLDTAHQEALLTAVVQSDDPVLLAELIQYLPAATKPSIQAKLRQLNPEDASHVWMWPEIQNRVDAFLTAGEFGLAREHLESVEPALHRAPQEFRLSLFSLGLQLLMMEAKWGELDAAAVPSSFDEASARQAAEYLAFYQATSQLLRPAGNLPHALVVLRNLAARPGAAPAYLQNAIAIAVRQLVGPTPRPVAGVNKVAAQHLLAEIDAALAVEESSVRKNLLVNRALLLLELERPADALASVAAHRPEARSIDLELIAVRANSEMGRLDEAKKILDDALLEFGNDDRLRAAGDDLRAGVPLSNVTSAVVTVDMLTSIRAALHKLSELPISQVGDLLGPPDGGVRGYLLREVSRAVSSLQHMSAMLRTRRGADNDIKLENDLNTVVREILRVSLTLPKWSVSDQSLGGKTAGGNPGERDAVIGVSNQEIAIYEALICASVNKANTRTHFHRLIGYGVCDIYFHVTYSYAKTVKRLLAYLRHMLEHETPAGFALLDCRELGTPDFECSGYLATYQVDHREVAVAFLIANLRA